MNVCMYVCVMSVAQLVHLENGNIRDLWVRSLSGTVIIPLGKQLTRNCLSLRSDSVISVQNKYRVTIAHCSKCLVTVGSRVTS